MSEFLKKWILWLGLSSIAALRALGGTNSESVDPALDWEFLLSSNSDQFLEVIEGAPVVLELSVRNETARRIRASNRESKEIEEFLNSRKSRKLSKEERHELESRIVYQEAPESENSLKDEVSTEWITFVDEISGVSLEAELIKEPAGFGELARDRGNGIRMRFRILSKLNEESLLAVDYANPNYSTVIRSNSVSVLIHSLDTLSDEAKLDYFYEAGNVHYSLIDADGVEKYSELMMEIDPYDPGAWELKSNALALRGKLLEAQNAMTRAIEAVKANPEKYPYEPRVYYRRLKELAGGVH